MFSDRVEKRVCYRPFEEILVGMNGEVFPCCGGEALFKKKVESGEYDFGNLLRQHIEDFQGNDYWKAIRYSALHRDNVVVPECSVCAENMTWNGHVRKSHILEWGNLAHQQIDFGMLRQMIG